MVAACLVTSGLLAGCASEPFVTGRVGEPVSAESVVIYYINKPDCDYETIAYLVMERPLYSRQALADALRNQAAELGASAVYIEQTQRLPGREYVGTARAIRCITGEAS